MNVKYIWLSGRDSFVILGKGNLSPPTCKFIMLYGVVMSRVAIIGVNEWPLRPILLWMYIHRRRLELACSPNETVWESDNFNWVCASSCNSLESRESRNPGCCSNIYDNDIQDSRHRCEFPSFLCTWRMRAGMGARRGSRDSESSNKMKRSCSLPPNPPFYILYLYTYEPRSSGTGSGKEERDVIDTSGIRKGGSASEGRLLGDPIREIRTHRLFLSLLSSHAGWDSSALFQARRVRNE
jgi:hypothetical protein